MNEKYQIAPLHFTLDCKSVAQVSKIFGFQELYKEYSLIIAKKIVKKYIYLPDAFHIYSIVFFFFNVIITCVNFLF